MDLSRDFQCLRWNELIHESKLWDGKWWVGILGYNKVIHKVVRKAQERVGPSEQIFLSQSFATFICEIVTFSSCSFCSIVWALKRHVKALRRIWHIGTKSGRRWCRSPLQLGKRCRLEGPSADGFSVRVEGQNTMILVIIIDDFGNFVDIAQVFERYCINQITCNSLVDLRIY